MGTLRHADRFDQLLAYQKARELAAEIFSLSQDFPGMRRSLSLARSVGPRERSVPRSPKHGESVGMRGISLASSRTRTANSRRPNTGFRRLWIAATSRQKPAENSGSD